ncbi:cell division protein ZapA [Polaromonas sp. OV174]|uniref:cell division protein ZapA n=1 Tax=Polaromonas sp. OV174 TaxID=1855300 RepID=UPI0008E5079D|nr:cell division protein ZapA [Polaromonas sp. OV174]SFB94050.1 cell division protein ZapA [Polaromonas sp. OV174]
MKQLEVQIMGQNYLLGCPENGDARLLEAVGRVDTAMCKIRDAGKIKARDRIAVLAALNLAFELPERSSLAEPEAAPQPIPEAATPAPQPQLTLLLQRLDGALGVDGQLL